MSQILAEVLAANTAYAANFGEKGYLYDVKSGQLIEIAEATTVGRAE